MRDESRPFAHVKTTHATICFTGPVRVGATARAEIGSLKSLKYNIFLSQLSLSPVRSSHSVPVGVFSNRREIMTKLIRAAGASTLAIALALGASLPTTVFAKAEKTVEVGGAKMFPSKNIVENAMESKDHTTLVTAVKAAGLVDTLSGKGPFTVFAPTNAAFEKLPKDTVPTLLKPENKGQLTNVLTYHVVAGTYSAEKIAKEAEANGGKLMLKTVEGAEITLQKDGSGWAILDQNGDKAAITIADVNQSNGVIHVIDTVLMPKL